MKDLIQAHKKLIKAVQELSAENTTLKARLDALEGS